MAAKSKVNQRKQKDTYKVKWVKKAQMFCTTIIKDGKQTQEWSDR